MTDHPAKRFLRGHAPSLPRNEDLLDPRVVASLAVRRIRDRRSRVGLDLPKCLGGPLSIVKAVTETALPTAPEHAYADTSDTLLIIDAVRERLNRQLDDWRLTIILTARAAGISNPLLAQLLHQQHKQGVRHVVTALQRSLADRSANDRLAMLAQMAEQAHQDAQQPAHFHPAPHPSWLYASQLAEHLKTLTVEVHTWSGVDIEEWTAMVQNQDQTVPLAPRSTALLRRILVGLVGRVLPPVLRMLLDQCPAELLPGGQS